MKEPILLHSCCAPCSSAILEWLLQNDYAPHVYYFNPNIFPEEEYLVRKNECIRYCEKLGRSVHGRRLGPRRLAQRRQGTRMRSRTRRTLQAVFRRAHEGHRRHGRKARHQALYDNPRREAAGSALIRFERPRSKRLPCTPAPPTGIRTGARAVCRSAGARSSERKTSTISSGAAANSPWDIFENAIPPTFPPT